MKSICERICREPRKNTFYENIKAIKVWSFDEKSSERLNRGLINNVTYHLNYRILFQLIYNIIKIDLYVKLRKSGQSNVLGTWFGF